jgi:hypothetical protein
MSAADIQTELEYNPAPGPNDDAMFTTLCHGADQLKCRLWVRVRGLFAMQFMLLA